MIIARTVAELRSAISGRDVGFAPTMGAFHQGHVSLMQKAKQNNETCVVSLFVNPTQFGPNEDFVKYPRNEDRDFEIAFKGGCDVIFVPSVDEIYQNSLTVLSVKGVTNSFEGAVRPTHFDGVSTVVAKLFGIVGPCHAYFGLKDLQQCAVIKTFVDELFLPVTLVWGETVRESSGLAMSSRNAYLSDADRDLASSIYKELSRTVEAIRPHLNSKEEILSRLTAEILRDSRHRLEEKGFELDYLEAIEFPSMAPKQSPMPNDFVICAARLSGIRLIDNLPLTPFA